MDFDDPRCLNLYRQAGRFKLPVLFDMQDRPDGYGLRDDYGLPKMEHALKECPDTIFIGHGPTFWAEISRTVPAGERSGYPKGPIDPGGAVPRLMRKYTNLCADTSAGSGYNALTRDPSFTLEFLDEFQDRIAFGVDSCRRSDVADKNKNVTWLKKIRASGSLSSSVIEKIEYKNALRILNLNNT